MKAAPRIRSSFEVARKIGMNEIVLERYERRAIRAIWRRQVAWYGPLLLAVLNNADEAKDAAEMAQRVRIRAALNRRQPE